jgi:nucleoside transporter
MPGALQLRLSLMMFMLYFMFGSWFVTLGTYMSKGLTFDAIIGMAYGTQGFAAVLSTLIVGVIADRYVPAQKMLGLLAAVSGVLLLLLARIDTSPNVFLLTILLHFLCFVPTIALSNAIALNALTDRARHFPVIRVAGTLGWICAGILVGSMPGAAATRLPLQIGGAAGVVLGLYSFTLPPTPPKAGGERFHWSSALGLDLVMRIRDRNFWIFILGVFVVMIPLAFYYTYCNNFLVEADANLELRGIRLEPAAIQTLGQASEFVFLLLLPAFLLRTGIKTVLIIGMLAWTVRYCLFAAGFDGVSANMTLLIAGVLMHGVCYDFFLVASQLYIDERFDASARTRAQSFLVMINMGAGIIIGDNFANLVYRANTLSSTVHNWRVIWLVPAGVALIAGLIFAFLFRPDREVRRPLEPTSSPV